jgi:hypothetical protein
MIQTLQQAKDFLRANFKKGCKCPACGQTVKLYSRKINSGMAVFLIGIYRLDKRHQDSQPGMISKAFFSNKHIMQEMNINTSSLDYSVLKHFGLIEARVSEAGKKDSGFWKITHEGILFVKHGRDKPKNVFLYNNKIQGFSEETTTIKQALGDKFDFEELMSNQ